MRIWSCWILGVLFMLAGVNHFAAPRFYLSIMPPYLPAHLALVYVSGVAEILGGLGVLVRRTRWLAGWGLIALLVAVFPANVFAATSGIAGSRIPTWTLWARLPLQGVLIWWVYVSSMRKSKA